MTKNVTAIVLFLVLAIVGLSIALGVSLANDDDGMVDDHQAMMTGQGSGYTGMLDAMGHMDADAMHARMRAVLGEGGYAQMLQHMADHQAGEGAVGPGMDGMMHQMMDGMMGHMGMFGTSTPTPTP
jgi:hypothetical protein